VYNSTQKSHTYIPSIKNAGAFNNEIQHIEKELKLENSGCSIYVCNYEFSKNDAIEKYAVNIYNKCQKNGNVNNRNIEKYESCLKGMNKNDLCQIILYLASVQNKVETPLHGILYKLLTNTKTKRPQKRNCITLQINTLKSILLDLLQDFPSDTKK
jgi:hypothetical protein